MSAPPPTAKNDAPIAVSEADRAVLGAIKIVVGPKGWIDGEADMAPYLHDQRGLYVGRALAVVRPANTEEVAGVVSLCAAAKLPIVPQGGNTGLVIGSVPDGSGRSIVLSLARMNNIRALDTLNNTMTVDAGCVLANLQQAAADAGRLFPLSLGAEGSCMIGGNLSTNAGGVQVLRYGNARNLVLGLEVVLPDGRVWDGLRALRKDNTGYDLKQLFMGAEGTLGIITGAVLRLFPQPRSTVTVFAAVPKLADVMELLGEAQAASGEAVRAFELIPEIGVDFVTRHIEGAQRPLKTVSPWYVLMEFAGGDDKLRALVEGFLEKGFEAGRIADATIAESETQAKQLWRIRETLPEAQTREGASIKHDVAVPISRIVDLIETGAKRLTDWLPGARPFPFGHIGDGNIHFNVSQPPGMDKAAFIGRWDEANRIVHDLTAELNGSFSAEHGIGRLKRAELAHYRSKVELDLMRKLKAAIDPDDLLNPGIIL
ncbi:MAG TPA: FAD-binding oxidoreductase [Alphaproteobacteria bacterium]|nr:FAD-binding oxidoreductase [Alphaproteobacteria bacterium]